MMVLTFKSKTLSIRKFNKDNIKFYEFKKNRIITGVTISVTFPSSFNRNLLSCQPLPRNALFDLIDYICLINACGVECPDTHRFRARVLESYSGRRQGKYSYIFKIVVKRFKYAFILFVFVFSIENRK